MSGTTSKGGTSAGAVLSIMVGATLTPILQIKEYDLPEAKWKYDTITNSNSPTIGVGNQVLDENAPTVVDPGEASFSGIWLPSDAGQQAVAASFATGTAVEFTLQLKPIAGQTTTGNLYTWMAFVQALPMPSGLSVDKVAQVKISLKMASLIAVTVGS
jgi:hypothetical protein